MAVVKLCYYSVSIYLVCQNLGVDLWIVHHKFHQLGMQLWLFSLKNPKHKHI